MDPRSEQEAITEARTVVATVLGRRAGDLQVLERRTVALLFDDARYEVVTVRDHATGETPTVAIDLDTCERVDVRALRKADRAALDERAPMLSAPLRDVVSGYPDARPLSVRITSDDPAATLRALTAAGAPAAVTDRALQAELTPRALARLGSVPGVTGADLVEEPEMPDEG
jgi:hypothetical protein